MLNFFSTIAQSQYGFIFHYYRGEVYRETNWRNRLDATTNWSIVVSAAMLSYTFSNPVATHSIILVNMLIVFFFLYIESRRFRYYNVLRRRTRLMERHIFGPLFEPSVDEAPETWKTKLAESLYDPKLAVSKLEAIAWRLRRNYVFLFLFLYIAWLARLSLSAAITLDPGNLIVHAQTWVVPGSFVFPFVTVILFVLIGISIYIPNASHLDDLP